VFIFITKVQMSKRLKILKVGMAKAPETDGENETRTGWVRFGGGLVGLDADLGIDIITRLITRQRQVDNFNITSAK
jgi:hypothetical protein